MDAAAANNVTPQNCTVDYGHSKIVDGGFEQGITDLWQNEKAGVQWTGDAHTGGGALLLDSECAAKGVSNFKAGELLTVSGYFKSVPNTGWSSIGMDFFDSNWNEISENYISLGPNSGYDRFTMNATPPAGTAHVSLWFCGDDGKFDTLEVR